MSFLCCRLGEFDFKQEIGFARQESWQFVRILIEFIFSCLLDPSRSPSSKSIFFSLLEDQDFLESEIFYLASSHGQSEHFESALKEDIIVSGPFFFNLFFQSFGFVLALQRDISVLFRKFLHPPLLEKGCFLWLGRFCAIIFFFFF